MCYFIIPENSHIHFPWFVNTKYADGTEYKEVFDIASNENGTEIMGIDSDKLPSFSLKVTSKNPFG